MSLTFCYMLMETTSDLLKEKAMEYVMGNMDEVAVSTNFARLYQSESITKEIMISQAKRIKRGY